MLRKFEVPQFEDFQEPFTVARMLDQCRHFEVGRISIGRPNHNWLVYLNGVCWNCQIKGSDTVEGYGSLSEATFVAARLYRLLKEYDSDSAVLVLMDELNEFSTAKGE